MQTMRVIPYSLVHGCDFVIVRRCWTHVIHATFKKNSLQAVTSTHVLIYQYIIIAYLIYIICAACSAWIGTVFSIFREAKILSQLRESSSILFIGYGIYIIYHFGQHCYLSNPQFVLKKCLSPCNKDNNKRILYIQGGPKKPIRTLKSHQIYTRPYFTFSSPFGVKLFLLLFFPCTQGQ